MNLFIFFFILASGCNIPKQDTNVSKIQSKPSKAILERELNFSVSTENSSNVGYKIWEEDEDEGVKSICIHDKYIYFTDVYYNNIKKVNIITGEITAGSKTHRVAGHFNDKIWLRDIAVFNERLYATSDLGYVFIFDLNMNLMDSIHIEQGQPYFYSISNDKLSVFINDRQQEDLSIEVTLLSFNKANKHKQELLVVPIDEYKKRSTSLYIKGNQIELDKSRKKIKTKFWEVELNEEIPKINAYDAFNIDFTENNLVFFDATPQNLVIKVYKIE